MAQVRFGGGVAEMRGSTAGTTYTRTKAGSIARQRVKPAQPNTSYQIDQRSIITELSQAWSQTLTQSQRDAWTEFGVSFPSTNKLGEAVILSGVQAFQRIGARMLAAGEAFLSDAPANQDVSELQTITGTYDVGAGAFQLAWTSTGTLTDDLLIVEVTPGISSGISNYSNRLRPIVYTAVDPTSPTNLEAGFIARFGSLPLVGQKIGVRAHFLRTTNGARSSDLGTSGIVVST